MKKLLPFSLTALAVGIDQISKFYIVKNWPKNGTFIKDVFGNEFLEIYHVRNTAIAFSLGHNLPDMLRPFLFILVPAAVLVFLVVYYFKSDEFTPLQRWSIAGILGGGIGNLIDRVFRPEGVVDFISVNFYGFLGFSRWPTFNFADSFVVVFGLILLVTIFVKDSALARNAKRREASGGPEKTTANHDRS
ncbi:MAG: signal peptidase II [Treponema sp.]|jgi:signal peptidase II|nr:signal peptidase II [Treponema sp.]